MTARAPKTCIRPYEPLGVLKPVAADLWIIDGPEIRMRVAGLGFPFPTRATVIRLPSGRLWIHSPVAVDAALKAALDGLGEVAFLIAPNRLHHAWIEDWRALWPRARRYGSPDLVAALPDAFDEPLGETPPAAWGGAFDQLVVAGDVLVEAVFHHRATRTMILTDLIENFEPDRVCGRWRWLLKLAGAADPDGKAPIDMQLSYWRARRTVRMMARTMIGWAPERVILAHGRWYDRVGAVELRRAFRWVLGRRAD